MRITDPAGEITLPLNTIFFLWCHCFSGRFEGIPHLLKGFVNPPVPDRILALTAHLQLTPAVLLILYQKQREEIRGNPVMRSAGLIQKPIS